MPREVTDMQRNPAAPTNQDTSHPTMTSISLNGETRDVPTASSIADLVATLDRGSRGIAVAVNREVVPRARWSECVLQAGDRVDVVQAIGGG